MPLTHSEAIMVKNIKGKGRGVFARRRIKAGQIIERVPVIVLPVEQVGNDTKLHALSKYVFAWGPKTFALALGYGSLYNHSYRPNARYDDWGRTKKFVAIREITAGEEITVNYNGAPDDRSPVWFDVLETDGEWQNQLTA